MRLVDAVPDPVLRSVRNFTPFRRRACQKMGKGRVFYDCVVVKGTYDLGAGVLRRSAAQAPITLSDRYHDEDDAAVSSLRAVGDLHLPKPGTDVVVTGLARPPGGRPAPRWPCAVLVHDGARPILHHRVEATGPRRWVAGAFGGWTLSPPQPTDGVPIRYELAYGGAYVPRAAAGEAPRRRVHRDNPSGTGFLDEDALDRRATYAAPQWEVPGHPVEAMNRPSPLAGFGPVARMWAARTRHGGTYDAAWTARAREEAARGIVPDYPADLDPRFFHCAHPDLRSMTPLDGTERYLLTGLAGDELAFRLPGERPRAEVLPLVGDFAERPLQLDLVHVDLDARKVFVTWRLCLDPRDEIVAVILTHAGGDGHA